MNKKKMMSLQVSTGSYRQMSGAIINSALSRGSNYVCVANAHMVVEARRSEHFASIVNNAAIVTPDGVPITWAFNILYGMKQERVAGMDLLPDLLLSAEGCGLPVFFYGGTPSLLLKAERFLHGKFPALKIAGMYSPPFRELTAAEEDEVAAKINASGTRLVFVILGCPRQERWMARMKGRVHALMVGVGGALPVLIGMQRRAPVWMQRNGLEWLYRLMQEPRRLFWRYAVTNTVFCWLFITAVVNRSLMRKSVVTHPGNESVAV